jgi:hypothetical protein
MESLDRPLGRWRTRLAIDARRWWRGAKVVVDGSGPGIPLGLGGAPLESTRIQPYPQDCSNWFAHANGWVAPLPR